MRWLGLLMLALIAVTVEIALGMMNPIKKEGLYITTNMVYQNQNKNIKLRKAAIFEGLNYWVPLTDATEGITLLGRITERKGSMAHFEFIVMDASTATPFVISNIGVDASLGEKATTTVATDAGATAKISIMAHDTEFTEFR